MLPFESLDTNSVSSAIGRVGDLEGTGRVFTLAVATGGSPAPTAGSVLLEGSVDGFNWYTLGSVSITNGVSSYITTSDTNPHYVRYVRASMSGVSGGGSETVNASIAPA